MAALSGRLATGHHRTPTAPRLMSSPRRRWRRRFVEHEKERRLAGPSFASSPLPSDRAGRGHRRALDGPSMPPPLQESRCIFVSPPRRHPASRDWPAPAAGRVRRRAAQGWGRRAQRASWT